MFAVELQPQLDFSFMTSESINSGGDGHVINTINTGTSASTLNADGMFSGIGAGHTKSSSWRLGYLD